MEVPSPGLKRRRMTTWHEKQKMKMKAKKKLEATYQKYGLKQKRHVRLRGAVSKPLLSAPFYRTGNTFPTSDTITRVMGKRDLLTEHKWKTDSQESKETIQEINKKRSRIAPAYSKGSYQYITDAADAKTLGRKV